MIASIFSKSKPVNIIIIAAFLILISTVYNWSLFFTDISRSGQMVLNLIVLLFSLLIFDFINSKNNITQRNGFAVLCFGLVLGLFPEIIKHSELIWSNMFLLFAFRRMFSLHSRKHVKKKLFDSGFWIGLAILINPTLIFALPVLVIAVSYYSGNDVKTAIIPIVGLLCVLVIKICYNILVFDTYFLETDFQVQFNLDFSNYWEQGSLIRFVPFFLILLWSLIKVIASYNERNTDEKPTYMILIWYTICSLLIIGFSVIQDGGQMIFLLAPASFVVALNMETIEREWITNTIIGVFILVIIINLVL